MDRSEPARIRISPGEFYDRWTILNLKCEYLTGDQQARAYSERAALETEGEQLMFLKRTNGAFAKTVEQLQEANRQLWHIENRIRELDGKVFPLELSDMDDSPYAQEVREFIEAARSVYVTNDQRSAHKGTLNTSADWLPELKQYHDYEEDHE